jgi:hypothetical protein
VLERYFSLRIECLEVFFTQNRVLGRYFSLRIESLEGIFTKEGCLEGISHSGKSAWKVFITQD